MVNDTSETGKTARLNLQRCPGGQAQFSIPLRAQTNACKLGSLLDWIVDNLRSKITVEVLADRAAMSMRTFARTFVNEIGITPARHVEQLRLEQAVRYLEASTSSDETVADECGFSGAEQLRRSFRQYYGISPHAYRKRFRTNGEGE